MLHVGIIVIGEAGIMCAWIHAGIPYINAYSIEILNHKPIPALVCTESVGSIPTKQE